MKICDNSEMASKEVELFRKLKNPYILEYFDYFVADYKFYIVMEYCKVYFCFLTLLRTES